MSDGKPDTTQMPQKCCDTGEFEAWLTALLTNSRYDYRTPEGRIHIRGGCYEDSIDPQPTPIGTSGNDMHIGGRRHIGHGHQQ